jgi:hypothetical protein
MTSHSIIEDIDVVAFLIRDGISVDVELRSHSHNIKAAD